MNPKFQNMDAPAPSDEYKVEFKALTALVQQKVMDRKSRTSIFDLYEAMLAGGATADKRSRLIPLFARDAEILLAHAQKGRALIESGSVFSSPEASYDLLERLTGTWLAMYFLGCPIIHLWEAVAFFAEGSGFPRGASLCKAVGDVYRGARKSYLRLPAHLQLKAEECQMYVLDHNPLLIKKMVDAEKNQRGNFTFSNYVIFLGMLYERLQLALYLHAGGPMQFLVPSSSLKRALEAKADKRPQQLREAHAEVKPPNEEEQRAKKIEFMWAELSYCFPKKFSQKQFIRIVGAEALVYMPGCVLRPNHGVFRTREAPPDFHPGSAGNYLSTRVRQEFETKLKKVAADTKEETSLQTGEPGDFHRACASLFKSPVTLNSSA